MSNTNLPVMITGEDKKFQWHLYCSLDFSTRLKDLLKQLLNINEFCVGIYKIYKLDSNENRQPSYYDEYNIFIYSSEIEKLFGTLYYSIGTFRTDQFPSLCGAEILHSVEIFIDEKIRNNRYIHRRLIQTQENIYKEYLTLLYELEKLIFLLLSNWSKSKDYGALFYATAEDQTNKIKILTELNFKNIYQFENPRTDNEITIFIKDFTQKKE